MRPLYLKQKGFDKMYYCIVKKPMSFISLIPVAVLLLITALICYFTTTIYPYLSIFVAFIGIALSLWLLPRTFNCEYEYSIEGDLFTVSIIRNKASRKVLFSTDAKNLVSCAPFDEADKSSLVRQKINASVDTNTLYYALFSVDETTTAVLFSPDDEFIKSFRLLAPLKVKCNILH